MSFNNEVTDALKFYVYRLIDPRNGETFYVGKGKGNRVFAHAEDKIGSEEDGVTEKLKRIREIKNAGFSVSHVIHRHGLDEKTAYEVEAALMDAFPATANVSGGHGSGDRGIMHANEIIEKFKLEFAEFLHPILIIKINRSATEKSIYEAVRYAWKLDRKRAQKAEFVLAVVNGIVVDVFSPVEWLDATPENFPDTEEPRLGRIGFIGKKAPETIRSLYYRKRLPEEYRRKGAASPVRYVNIK